MGKLVTRIGQQAVGKSPTNLSSDRPPTHWQIGHGLRTSCCNGDRLCGWRLRSGGYCVWCGARRRCIRAYGREAGAEGGGELRGCLVDTSAAGGERVVITIP